MVPRSTVVFFGLGGVALGIVGNAVTYFLLIYYNQVLGVPAYLVSLAPEAGSGDGTLTSTPVCCPCPLPIGCCGIRQRRCSTRS
jgi:hypothetical protein